MYRRLRLQFLVLLMMGAVTPETCSVTVQWNKSDCILLHLVGILFNVNYDARNHELKIIIWFKIYLKSCNYKILIDYCQTRYSNYPPITAFNCSATYYPLAETAYETAFLGYKTRSLLVDRVRLYPPKSAIFWVSISTTDILHVHW